MIQNLRKGLRFELINSLFYIFITQQRLPVQAVVERFQFQLIKYGIIFNKFSNSSCTKISVWKNANLQITQFFKNDYAIVT